MKRVLFAVCAFIAVNAVAEVSDVRTFIEAPASANVGEAITFTATVENLGPDVARDVRWYAAVGYDMCHEDTLVVIQPGERRTVSCTTNDTSDRYFIRPRAYADPQNSDDPDESNNYSEAFVPRNVPPDLYVLPELTGSVDAALPFEVNVIIQNASPAAAENVTLEVNIPSALGYANPPENCTVAGSRLLCPLGTIAGANPATVRHDLKIHPIAPDASAAVIDGTFTLRATNGEAQPSDNTFAVRFRTYRTAFVTNTNDSGPGSLRAAIADANAHPTTLPFQSKIAFRIAGSNAVKTIHLLSPLPAISAPQLFVDGGTQRRYFADNAEGLEIELDGAAAGAAANGLDVSGCNVSIYELAINGFGGAGILHRGGMECNRPTIAGNYLGTDASGTRAVPNGRGMVVLSWPIIEKNVISGNRRSGLWIALPSTIQNNIIGLAADGTTPLGNGASGIYIAPNGGGGIANNKIAFNHDFGVAVDKAAKNVSIERNSIHANWQLGIDFGLDGPTPALMPEITSARWDASIGSTVVQGRAAGTCDIRYVFVYASDSADGEGQMLVGEGNAGPAGFIVPIAADLHGKWLTVTSTCGVGDYEPHGFVYSGSEFSAPVAVQ